MTFQQVNSKVVKAEISAHTPVLARRGAMLGYDGQVTFRPVTGQGNGLTGRVGAMMSSESNPMMAAEGHGTAYYGYRGLYVTVIDLTGDSFTVEADRLLAHDANLTTSVEFLGQGGVRAIAGGAMTGQGLFTSKVHGHGAIAVLSHGGTEALTVDANRPVWVDPQAYVGHTGALSVTLKAKVGLRDAVGRGSGEAFRLEVTGQGTVYVQASEQKF